MPILSNLLDRTIRRSGPNPATDRRTNSWSTAWPWSTPSVTGVTVNDASALSLTAFYRGVALLSGTLASLPIQVFQEEIAADGTEGPTRKIKTADTAYLWRRPNPEMTMQSFWERVAADEVRGNAFIFVQKDDSGGVLALWYIDRNRVRVGRTADGQKIYEIDSELPMIDYKQGGEIVHIPNWGGALVGYDPIKIAPQAIALGLSAEEYAARSFGQGQVPPGLITSDMTLTPDQAEALAKRWRDLHSGLNKQQDIAVLANGAKFQKVSSDMEAMQNLGSRGFQVAEIARLLGLQPHHLADVDHASQGGGMGVEEQNRQLTTFNLNAHINRIQQAVTDDLLVRELTNRYMRLNTAGLLKGNTLARYQAYRLADWMTDNEKRALEELEPIEGGDVLLKMTNMAPADKLEEIAMGAGRGGQ